VSDVGPQLVYSARERDAGCVPVARSLARRLADRGRPADGGWILACVVAPELWRPSALDNPARVLAMDAAELLAGGGEVLAAAEVYLAAGDRGRAQRLLERHGDPTAMRRLKDTDEPRLMLGQGGLTGKGSVTTLHAIRRRALAALTEVDDLVGEDQLLSLLELLGLDLPAARLAEQQKDFARAGKAWERAGKPIESARAWYRAGDTEQALATLVKVEIDHPEYRAACVLAIRLAARLERLDYALDHLVGSFVEQSPVNKAEQDAMAQLARLYFDNGHLGPADELRRMLRGEGRAGSERFDAAELPGLPTLPPIDSVSELEVEVEDTDDDEDEEDLLHLDPEAWGAVADDGSPSGSVGRREPQDSGERGVPPAEERSRRSAADAGQGASGEVAAGDDSRGGDGEGEDGEREDGEGEDGEGEDGEHDSLETWTDDLVPPVSLERDTSDVADARPSMPPAGRATPATVGGRRSSKEGESDSLVGMVVGGRYAVEALIGKGGTGVVYRAEDLELGEPVALKFLSGLTPDKASLARFRRELRLARRLTHHNIVRLFDLGEDRGSYFISMELLDGIVLRQAPRDRLPIEQKVAVIAQAAAGLAYAHSRAVVHRDVKPDNLFLTRDGVVKVMDFGLARAAGGHHVTITGLIAGTPTYMAPEQAKEFSAAGAASDQYSLAVVAYELLAGRPPFIHKEVLPLLRLHAETAPSPPSRYAPHLPRSIDGVICRALAKDPHARFPDIRALGRALCEAAGVRPAS